MKFILIIRERGSTKVDYSLEFEAPEIPRRGDYISIQRPDTPAPYGEDVIVRHVWWRLDHPETGGFAENPRVGSVNEIMVEADPALSPYSSDHWKKYNDGQPKFEVSRVSIGEAAMRKGED